MNIAPGNEAALAVQRTDVTFTSGGTTCAAWHYRRTGDTGQGPIVVMAHGFGAVRALRLHAYAQRFAAEGYQVFVFDYRCFGDSAGEPRQLLSISRQKADWRAAVAHVREMPSVDPARVVLWGTSFAGGHVLDLSSRDHGFAAVIAQVPHISGIAATRSVGLRTSVRLTVRGIVDQARALFGRSPSYIPSVGTPGTVAAMSSPDAVPGLDQLIAQSTLDHEITPAEKEVAARIILRMPFYSPGRRMRRIPCPVLVQIAERDVITPTAVALRAAHRLRDGRIQRYDLGHFDPYVAPNFDDVVTDQLNFLRDEVSVSG